ncbi:TPA: ModE family transcriptional regulator, partial [Candidatus Delongbacteria bacterium]|nr:ModE family transcriptional regulator [Candidatus Delongbacteria bacterium]
MNNNEIKIRFNYKIWIETSEEKGILGYGQMRLLKAINETGTLNNAMKEIGFNYRKSWSKLKDIESLLGFK